MVPLETKGWERKPFSSFSPSEPQEAATAQSSIPAGTRLPSHPASHTCPAVLELLLRSPQDLEETVCAAVQTFCWRYKKLWLVLVVVLLLVLLVVLLVLFVVLLVVLWILLLIPLLWIQPLARKWQWMAHRIVFFWRKGTPPAHAELSRRRTLESHDLVPSWTRSQTSHQAVAR